jgi:membrane-associated protein
LHDVVSGLLASLAGLPPALVFAAVTLFMVAETSIGIGLLVPGDVVVVLAGSTATSPGRFATVVAATVLGSLAGESLGWLLGRRFGARIRYGRLGRRMGERNWARAEAFLNGAGARSLIGARFVAVVHALAPVVAGSVGMPYRRFAGWSLAGTLMWSVVFTGAGLLAGASWRTYGERLGTVGWAVPAVVLAVVLLVRAVRKRRDAACRAVVRS